MDPWSIIGWGIVALVATAAVLAAVGFAVVLVAHAIVAGALAAKVRASRGTSLAVGQVWRWHNPVLGWTEGRVTSADDNGRFCIEYAGVTCTQSLVRTNDEWQAVLQRSNSHYLKESE